MMSAVLPGRCGFLLSPCQTLLPHLDNPVRQASRQLDKSHTRCITFWTRVNCFFLLLRRSVGFWSFLCLWSHRGFIFRWRRLQWRILDFPFWCVVRVPFPLLARFVFFIFVVLGHALFAIRLHIICLSFNFRWWFNTRLDLFFIFWTSLLPFYFGGQPIPTTLFTVIQIARPDRKANARVGLDEQTLDIVPTIFDMLNYHWKGRLKVFKDLWWFLGQCSNSDRTCSYLSATSNTYFIITYVHVPRFWFM